MRIVPPSAPITGIISTNYPPGGRRYCVGVHGNLPLDVNELRRRHRLCLRFLLVLLPPPPRRRLQEQLQPSESTRPIPDGPQQRLLKVIGGRAYPGSPILF